MARAALEYVAMPPSAGSASAALEFVQPMVLRAAFIGLRRPSDPPELARGCCGAVGPWLRVRAPSSHPRYKIGGPQGQK